jgi:hypothetical protein
MHWEPVNGTVISRESQDEVSTFRFGYRQPLFAYLDVEAALVYAGVLRQSLVARDENGNDDIRSTETRTYGLELSLMSRLGPVYLKFGGMTYGAHHEMQAIHNGEQSTIERTVHDVTVPARRWCEAGSLADRVRVLQPHVHAQQRHRRL